MVAIIFIDSSFSHYSIIIIHTSYFNINITSYKIVPLLVFRGIRKVYKIYLEISREFSNFKKNKILNTSIRHVYAKYTKNIRKTYMTCDLKYPCFLANKTLTISRIKDMAKHLISNR